MRKSFLFSQKHRTKAAAFGISAIFIMLVWFLLSPMFFDEYILDIFISILILVGFMGSACARTPKGQILIINILCAAVIVFSFFTSGTAAFTLLFHPEKLDEKVLPVYKPFALTWLGIAVFFLALLIVIDIYAKKYFRRNDGVNLSNGCGKQ